MSEILKAMGLTIVPNTFLSIQTNSGYKYCLAALMPSNSENFVSGFDEESNKVVAFPREQVIMIEFYSTLDEENKERENDETL